MLASTMDNAYRLLLAAGSEPVEWGERAHRRSFPPGQASSTRTPPFFNVASAWIVASIGQHIFTNELTRAVQAALDRARLLTQTASDFANAEFLEVA